MNETRLTSLEAVRAFLAGTAVVEFQPHGDGTGRYRHIAAVLSRFTYGELGRADKGLIRRYLERTTGYSRQQLTRLIGRWRQKGKLVKSYAAPVCPLPRKFTQADIALLAETDALHQSLSGAATCHLMQRAWAQYGDIRYKRLATISVAHLYNLRQKAGYVARRTHYVKTRGTSRPIGERRAPTPDGRPGFIRIDTVHQGDLDGVKGVYHINAVDCVTQWQLVASCEKISEAYLLPVIGALLEGFPFRILGFHADNGSEYINKQVSKLLEKLRVEEFTKSRPRHSNDNGLAEAKNGAVIRKILGYSHIPQPLAAEVNAFCAEYLNPYVNFHRPSLFAEERADGKGKIKKRYPRHLVQTPLEKLLSIPGVTAYLKSGIALANLQAQAKAISDNEEAAASLQNHRPTTPKRGLKRSLWICGQPATPVPAFALRAILWTARGKRYAFPTASPQVGRCPQTPQAQQQVLIHLESQNQHRFRLIPLLEYAYSVSRQYILHCSSSARNCVENLQGPQVS